MAVSSSNRDEAGVDEGEPEARGSAGVPGDADGRMITVALFRDAPLMREGLAAVLAPRRDVIGLVDFRAARLIDILLVDPWLCGMRSAADVVRLRHCLHPRHVVCFSWVSTDAVRQSSQRLGFDHLVSKLAPPEELVADLVRISGGLPLPVGSTAPQEVPTPTGQDAPRSSAHAASPVRAAEIEVPALSPRELQILRLIMTGISNQAISEELYLGLNTVKSYIRNLYGKIGVTTRPQAVRWGYEHLLPSDAHHPGPRLVEAVEPGQAVTSWPRHIALRSPEGTTEEMPAPGPASHRASRGQVNPSADPTRRAG